MSKTYIPSDLRQMITEQVKRCCEYCLQPEIFSFCVHEIDHEIDHEIAEKRYTIRAAIAGVSIFRWRDLLPPADSGVMCSNSNVTAMRASLDWQ
jgi:hypothetical protein